VGTAVLSGWPEAKLKPHFSQNWPALGVPQLGQGGPAAAGLDGAGGAEGTGLEGGGAAGAEVPAPIRMPQLSQKSELALSWPAGQVGITASFTSWS
jgi:hypothetical protein